MAKYKFSTTFPSKNTNVDNVDNVTNGQEGRCRSLGFQQRSSSTLLEQKQKQTNKNKNKKSKILHTEEDERNSFTLPVLTPSPKMAQLSDKTDHWTRNQPMILPMGRVRVCK